MSRTVRCAVRAALSTFPLTRLRSFEERFGVIVFTIALFFAMAQGLMAHEFKVGEIEISHPWSRATPNGAKVAAGYAVIKNRGSEPDRLIAATGEIAGKTQIHEMAVDPNGVMTMRELVDGLEVPAGGAVELKPGSFHIMFMELKQPAKEGEQFKGSLTFLKAGTVEVEFSVDALGSDGGHDAGHGNHGG